VCKNCFGTSWFFHPSGHGYVLAFVYIRINSGKRYINFGKMMTIGTVLCGVISVRAERSHCSEMLTQILFGERFMIHESNGEWLFVECLHDGYEGFIASNHLFVSEQCDKPTADVMAVTTAPLAIASKLSDGSNVYLPAGSLLHNYDAATGISETAGLKLQHDPNTVICGSFMKPLAAMTVAYSWINSTYLWGGRTVFGVDCSGFVQLIYRLSGLELPRDSAQQMIMGEEVPFVQQAKAGDLAFFQEEDGRVSHVGLITGPGKIIHCSGSVRADLLDQQGIFDATTGKYTHKLRLIKRVELNTRTMISQQVFTK